MTNLPVMKEEDFKALIAQIPPKDTDSIDEVERILATSTIKKDDFGALRFLLKKYAGATGSASFEDTPVKAVTICCADHGVAKENVSAYPPETTLHMVANYLISHGAAANVFADFTGAHLCVADLGINSEKAEELPGLIDFHIASGTNNSSQGPAMTREQAVKSLYYGYSLAKQLHQQQGITIFLPGEMGISNTTASAAITAALLEEAPANTTGRGTNISDERFKTKLATVEKILAVNKPDSSDSIDVLAKVGGFELGAIAGLMLGAAASHSLTILDGFNSSAAALIALRLAPVLKDYLVPSHKAGEQGQHLILKELDFTPMMALNIKLGEAIGSSLVADILDASIRAFKNIQKDLAAKELMADTIEKDVIPNIA
ncbi:MAG: nicotinate-nucleotide--dimethylbenzimidazole phosphoribosyltransferase, partial [Anaerovibrio sp.]|nr:nicotinate-nucleotide--dimethylbenzimidazole phosphoribosyltransferase [Anaerovibrio sp.]